MSGITIKTDITSLISNNNKEISNSNNSIQMNNDITNINSPEVLTMAPLFANLTSSTVITTSINSNMRKDDYVSSPVTAKRNDRINVIENCMFNKEDFNGNNNNNTQDKKLQLSRNNLRLDLKPVYTNS